MIPAIIGGAASIAGGLFGASSARQREAAARRERKRLTQKLERLEANRQDIINPYEGVQDLSSFISNPFANLSVATGAAEIKIEEADISLANTLDTMRATGASAGGATALAQAALRSKKGVAASIEAQEKSNEDKRVAGEERLEQRIAAEKQRIQGINISEGAREQQYQAAGRRFEFDAQEKRDVSKLNRLYGQQQQAQGAAAAARQSETSAIMGGINALGGAISSGAFSGPSGGGFSSESQEILANAPGGPIQTNTGGGGFSNAINTNNMGLNYQFTPTYNPNVPS